jgi:hypothetical protein
MLEAWMGNHIMHGNDIRNGSKVALQRRRPGMDHGIDHRVGLPLKDGVCQSSQALFPEHGQKSLRVAPERRNLNQLNSGLAPQSEVLGVG